MKETMESSSVVETSWGELGTRYDGRRVSLLLRSVTRVLARSLLFITKALRPRSALSPLKPCPLARPFPFLRQFGDNWNKSVEADSVSSRAELTLMELQSNLT